MMAQFHWGGQRLKRWLVFLLGMFLMGTGIAMIIKAGLGVSPVSSFTTIANKLWPALSLGTYSFLYAVLFFIGELLLAPKRWSPKLLLQLAASAVSSVFIDLNMILLGWINPVGYLFCFVLLLLGCVVFGLSLALMVSANVVLMPTEAFCSVAAERFHLKWGNVKSAMDIATVIFCVVASLSAFGAVYFIREGTVIGAVLNGQFSRLFQRWTDKIFPPVPSETGSIPQ